MTAGFSRETSANGKTENALGSIFYSAALGTGGKIILKVVEPVNQLMIFEGKNLLIYYPESKRAFLIESANPFILPFFQFFIDNTREDFGLSSRGFVFSRYEKKDALLFSYWTPSEAYKPFVSEVVLVHSDNALFMVQTKDVKGDLSSEFIYKQHVSLLNVNFPQEITIKTYENNSVSIEKVNLRNITLNGPLPEELINFRIPDDANIKKVRW